MHQFISRQPENAHNTCPKYTQNGMISLLFTHMMRSRLHARFVS
ncbi:hypothetical protein [Wielerella bovis]|nr:hypothetical protein [Wielerella bovis]